MKDAVACLHFSFVVIVLAPFVLGTLSLPRVLAVIGFVLASLATICLSVLLLWIEVEKQARYVQAGKPTEAKPLKLGDVPDFLSPSEERRKRFPRDLTEAT